MTGVAEIREDLRERERMYRIQRAEKRRNKRRLREQIHKGTYNQFDNSIPVKVYNRIYKIQDLAFAYHFFA